MKIYIKDIIHDTSIRWPPKPKEMPEAMVESVG